jgi:DNA-binding NarL/FixJ family response regulator
MFGAAEKNPKTRVLLAEDHAILRDGLKALLEREPAIEVVAEAVNGQEAVRLASQLVPDLIIMDLSMPGTNGTEAIPLIKRRYNTIKIIALTVHNTEEYVRATLDAGADGYVLKEDSHRDLVAAIKSVTMGKSYLSPGICNQVVNGFLSRAGSPPEQEERQPHWDALTVREREILKLVAEGKRNKDISDYLSISVKTVEKHRANLMRKLGVRNASELTAFAIRHKLMVG